MNLIYKEINNDNLMLAVKTQMKIFPEESALEHYKWGIKTNREYEKNYLVYDSDKIVGVTGIYSNEDLEDSHSIWLGWFDVLEKYRKKGYGTIILNDTINFAKELSKKYPIKYFRLYTDKEENKTSLYLYDKVMDIKEVYNNKDDLNYNGNCVIYSKSLTDEIASYWNNRFLNLKQIILAEEISNSKMKEELQ